MANILVTGASGFIGSELCKFFSCSPHNIIEANRSTLDVASREDVDFFFDNNKVDVVLHAAIKGGRRTKKDTHENFSENITMFENLLRHKERYKLFISFGSGAESRKDTHYGLAKSIIANKIKKHDNMLNLRLFGCFGINESPTRFIRSCVSNLMKDNPIVIHQNKYMDFFSIDDLCRVVNFYVQNINTTLPRELDMCYSPQVTLLDIAEYIKSLTQSDLRIIIEEKSLGSPYVGDPSMIQGLDIPLEGLWTGVENMVKGLLIQENE